MGSGRHTILDTGPSTYNNETHPILQSPNQFPYSTLRCRKVAERLQLRCGAMLHRGGHRKIPATFQQCCGAILLLQRFGNGHATFRRFYSNFLATFLRFYSNCPQHFGDFTATFSQRFGDFIAIVPQRFGDFTATFSQRFGDFTAMFATFRRF